MQIAKNKTMATLIATFLMLTIAFTLVALPVANAHDPPWTNVPTWAYLAISPDPAGVGQSVALVFTLNWVPPGAGGPQGDRWRNLSIEVTKPDGSKETLGPFTSDPVGGSYTYYTPDQVGTYTFNFSFPGQTVSLGPTGLASVILTNLAYVNDTFLPSSTTKTLTVQQEQIPGPPTYPLPTEYWTRPIEGQNTAWASIASNWLAGNMEADVYNVQPYGIAPNSPHIMWTKPYEDAGVVGGEDWAIPDATYYTGLTYEPRFNSPLIINGRLYYDLPMGSSSLYNSAGDPGSYGAAGGYLCVDLRTGETLWLQNWTLPQEIPVFGQLYDFEAGDQHGVLPGVLWSVNGSTWQAYDALTGSWLYTLTNVPSTSLWGQVYGPSGEILRYVLKYDETAGSGWLGLWNNTASLYELGGYNGTGSYAWRPNRKIIDMSKAYSWNVTIPSLQGHVGGSLTVRKVIPDDSLLCSFGNDDYNQYADTRNPVYTGFAISLKPASRGQLLWIKNYTTTGNVTRMWALSDVENRVFTIADMQTMSWSGYSMDTGDLLWGPVHDEGVNDYDYYIYAGIGTFNTAAQSIHNGTLYLAGQSGKIYARDTKAGKLLWTYPGNPTYEGDPWPLWPIYIGAIADGKIYTFTFEHSASEPLRKGARVYCLNETTGEEIWSLMSWAHVGHHSRRGPREADGYLTYMNAYDGQVYSIGKGPSATTVEAPMTAITVGNSVVIRGTVTDIAAGTKQKEQAARFPDGVPAVSDASMSAWMEYVYMQKPRPTNATGVEVSLDTLDPNGNFVHIGTATSDASGNFHLDWKTPDVPGDYTIIATFAGSESYYASYAETYAIVSEAPVTTPPTQTTTQESPMLTYVLAAVIALIIVVVASVVLLLRRK
jgi:hypothetical protein